MMGALLWLGPGRLSLALAIHAVAAPLIFTLIAWHYFRARGARDPVVTALSFVSIVATLDLLVVATGIQRSLVMFTSVVGTWLPFVLNLRGHLGDWSSDVDERTAPERTAKPTLESTRRKQRIPTHELASSCSRRTGARWR
jgi:ABC-type nitrate/sulfonate/bicarbonate transport system permease component